MQCRARRKLVALVVNELNCQGKGQYRCAEPEKPAPARGWCRGLEFWPPLERMPAQDGVERRSRSLPGCLADAASASVTPSGSSLLHVLCSRCSGRRRLSPWCGFRCGLRFCGEIGAACIDAVDGGLIDLVSLIGDLVEQVLPVLRHAVDRGRIRPSCRCGGCFRFGLWFCSSPVARTSSAVVRTTPAGGGMLLGGLDKKIRPVVFRDIELKCFVARNGVQCTDIGLGLWFWFWFWFYISYWRCHRLRPGGRLPFKMCRYRQLRQDGGGRWLVGQRCECVESGGAVPAAHLSFCNAQLCGAHPENRAAFVAGGKHAQSADHPSAIPSHPVAQSVRAAPTAGMRPRLQRNCPARIPLNAMRVAGAA